MVYRASQGGCPRCGARLDGEQSGEYRFSRCPSCRGVWMEESTFRAMLAEMGFELGLVPESTVAEEAIACTFCNKAMHKATLFSIVLDRCARHGIWFDSAELQKTLAGSAGLDVDPERSLENEVSLLHQVFAGGGKTE